MLSILLIFCLGILVYSNTFFCSFQFDDVRFIVDNPAIRNIQDWQGIWHYFHGRFFTFLSLAFNYHFNGLHVFGYHLFNLVIHLLSAVFIWWLTLLTLSTPAMKDPPAGEAGDKITRHADLIALFAGLVFVSHPVQTEAVTYIWQRAASMMTLFYVASLCFYVKSRLLYSHTEYSFRSQDSKPTSGLGSFYYICSLITAVVAMFTKENAITLPLMVLFYEFTFLKTKRGLNWKHMIPFLMTIWVIPVTFLFIKVQTFQEMHGNLRATGTIITPMQYFLTQFRVMVTYIRLVFLPFKQNLDYDYPIFNNIFEWPVFISLLFLITIFYAAKRLFSKYRLVSFSIFWFFLTLILPESSFWAMGDVISEHRLYLPLVGYSMFLVSGVYYLSQKNTLKTMVIVLLPIIAFNSVLTYQRNKVWKNEFTLWDDAVKKSPHKARPYYNRGRLYQKQGNLTLALFDYNKAIEINPIKAEAYSNRGGVYDEQGNFSQAISDCTRAIEIDPDDSTGYANRGVAYFKQGNLLLALSDYNKAIEINPDIAEVYYNRGNIYDNQGNLTQALSDYNKAIEINPDYAQVYKNRGSVHKRQGHWLEAISDYTKAIAVNPEDTELYMDRGTCYVQQGDFTQAISDYNKVIGINPNIAEVYNNRGNVYNIQGNLTQALSDYNKAVEIKPKYAEVYYNRGNIYDNQGNFAQALSDYNKAIEINPDIAQAYYIRAVTYYHLKKYDKAWADVHKAKKLGAVVNPNFINDLRQASNNARP